MPGQIPVNEISLRINNLQGQIARKGWDACLILSNVNLYYYTGTVQRAYLYVPQEGEPVLFVQRNYERARKEAAIKHILKIGKPEEIEMLLQELGLSRPGKIGMELETLPVKEYERWLKVFKKVEVLDATSLIRKQRAIKSPYEIGLLKENGKKAKEVFSIFPDIIESNHTDYELGARVEYEFRKRGHLGLIRSHGLGQDFFFGQVLVGENGVVPSPYDIALGGQGLALSFPQGTSGTIIKDHQPILIDYVVNFNGYNVDITRSYSRGKLPPVLDKAYQVALEIQNKIVRMAAPGVSCENIYKTAVEVAGQYQLEKNFMGYYQQAKFVGHGIGLELNELPVLAAKFKVRLQPGMVVAVEPKFAFPGLGAVGIENTFVMGARSFENITPLSEELIIV